MLASNELIIRREQPSDYDEIKQVIQLAFEDAPYSAQQEHLIVQTLRSAGALNLGIVAQISADIIGFAGISPVQISDGAAHWYGLGPIAVLPRFQGQSVGSMLVDDILSRLKSRGAAGCVVLGDPDFYGRFGFEPDQRLEFA
ncbi:MAG: N-acetyltransferase, partial [Pseudomonadales bacterium]